jgi:hypothetical protein
MRTSKTPLGLPQIASLTPPAVFQKILSLGQDLMQNNATTENISETTHRLIIYISVLFLSTRIAHGLCCLLL